MTNIPETIFDSLGIVSSDSKQLFLDRAVIKDVCKNKDVFVEGRKNESEYILISGVAHRYNHSGKSDIVTTGFYMAPSVITPHFARTSKGKSIFSLRCLTDAIFAEIPVRELDHLRHSNHEFHEFGQRIIEAELTQTFYNEIVFRSFDAKERLLTLRKQFPNLENLVPHHIIASYLGITNVSFSRLRNELARQ